MALHESENHERRDTNRLAREIMATSNSHDEFFEKMKEIDPAFHRFANFPRRILTRDGYDTTMSAELLKMKLRKHDVRERLENIDVMANERPQPEATLINIQDVKEHSKLRRDVHADLLDASIRGLHKECWTTLEEAKIAEMLEPSAGGMHRSHLQAESLQMELEMRETLDLLVQHSSWFREKPEYFAGNEKLWDAYNNGDREIREVLYQCAKHLMLNQEYEFSEIW